MSLALRIKFGLDWMWVSLCNNISRIDPDDARQLLRDDKISDAKRREYTAAVMLNIPRSPNELALANVIIQAMRLFYKLPLTVDQDALREYITELPVKQKFEHWTKFIVEPLPLELSRNISYATNRQLFPSIPEAYVWCGVHYLATCSTETYGGVEKHFFTLSHVTKNLIYLISCSICQRHFQENAPINLQFAYNLITSIAELNTCSAVDSNAPSTKCRRAGYNVFLSTCLLHRDINVANQNTPLLQCGHCNETFSTVLQRQAHQLEFYRDLYQEYCALRDADTEKILELTSDI